MGAFFMRHRPASTRELNCTDPLYILRLQRDI